MVTTTDDQSDRLTALEAGVSELSTEVRVLSTRVTALETGVSELRSEIRADIRALNDRQDRLQADMTDRLDRFQAEMTDRLDRFQAEMTDRLDRFQAENARHQAATNARIDRVFWAVISVGLLVGAGIIGTMLTLVFRLS